MNKSTPEEIRARFDAYVDRFSNLDTGQSTTIDAPLVLELLSQAAAACTPHAAHLLDVGCGAGNNALKILQRLPHLDVTLIDLSPKMLERAQQRIRPASTGKIKTICADIRDTNLRPAQFDLITAAAVLHHLREEPEWQTTFQKLYDSLRPGGSLWISDLITHDTPAIQQMMWHRYGQYLDSLKPDDPAHRQKVFDYIAAEDTPRSLLFQLNLLRSVGFNQIEVLHKTSVFAAFGAIKE